MFIAIDGEDLITDRRRRGHIYERRRAHLHLADPHRAEQLLRQLLLCLSLH